LRRDVDIAALIAKELGLRLELMTAPAGENVDADFRNFIWRGPTIGARSEGAVAVDAVADFTPHVPCNRELETRNELAALFSPDFEDRIAIVCGPAQFEARAFPLFDLKGNTVAVELDTLGDVHLSLSWDGKLRGGVRRFFRTGRASPR
jgi:hypothetical protein